MFGNNPFLGKKDPLLEAVKSAQAEGAMRRQAEALVNEAYGVYSRKAVIREHLSAYDAALESTYQELKEGKDPSVQGSGDVTKSAPKEDPSLPKSYPGAASSAPTAARLSNAKASVTPVKEGVTAPKDWSEKRHPNKGAVTKAPVPGVSIAEEDIDEAAYSAKAGRAGKDLGKPGKQFAKIAAKAGKKYGSEERGQKVAGAILAKIRAKHVNEMVVQKSQMKPGETLGQAMNRLSGKTAIKGGKNDPSSPSFTGNKDSGATPTPKSTTPTSSASPSSVSSRTIPSAPKKSMGPEVDPVMAGYDKPAQSSAPAPEAKPTPMPTMAQSGVGPKLGAGTGAGTTSSTPSGDKVSYSAPDIKSGQDKMKTMASLKEDVQVGENKYRIV